MARPTITPYTDGTPQRGQAEATFTTNMNDFVAWLLDNGFADEVEALAAWIEDQAGTTEQDLADATALNTQMLALANFQGRWSDLTGAIATGESVEHDGVLWVALEAIADVTAEEPSAASTVWGTISGFYLSERTTNVALRASDIGQVIVIEDSFTQTVQSISTLPVGWFCYLKNDTSADITVDADGSETINGSATYTLKAGELSTLVRGESELKVLRDKPEPGYEEFTSDGTYTKDPRAKWITVEVVNGGNSGSPATGNTSNYGGAGGIAVKRRFRASEVPASVSVTVGAGGAAASAVGSTNTTQSGNYGGTSSFGTLLANIDNQNRSSVFDDPWLPRFWSGQGDSSQNYQYDMPNTGPGGSAQGSTLTEGGSCLQGGAGGGSVNGSAGTAGVGGKSVEHGDGGDGVVETDADATGNDGEFPGGGGSSAVVLSPSVSRTATSGAGGGGVVRVWEEY